MKTVLIICTITFLTAFADDVRSQGCGDAGVCTIHGMNPAEMPDSVKINKNRISTGLYFGMSQNAVVVLTPFVEYTRVVSENISLTAKFNYGLRMGELANTHGPSDLLLSMSYNFLKYFTMTGGVKVPLSDANKKIDGQPLPMNYQTSLGTTDIMLGFGYRIKRFSFTAGYQQPVTHNSNKFLASDYPVDSPDNKYYSTRNYDRAGDIMLRASVRAVQAKKFIFNAGILPIYHLQNDTYQEPDGERVTINGSQGLTLNLNANLQYQFLPDQLLELIIGAPVVSRKVRPDGLSTFAIGVKYSISL